MDKYDYPGKQNHFDEHKKFIKELKVFRVENYDYSEDSSQDLLVHMGEWILSHILGDDITLGSYILEQEKKRAIQENKGT